MFGLEVWEAKRLIEEGWRPYIRKTGKGEYITLKKGSRERGVGPFKQELWQELDTHWTLVNFGSLSTLQTEPKSQHQPRLDWYDAQNIFAWLEAGYDPAQIVKETGHHPDKVEVATKRYLQLKGLKPQDQSLKEFHEKYLQLKTTFEVCQSLLKAIEKFGEHKQKTCYYFDGESQTCSYNWGEDAENIPLIKTETIHMESWLGSEKRLRVTPSKLACTFCPHYREK